MTEADWLACDDPWVLLNHLAGEPSERKYRLFACACCRRIWHLLTDQWSRKTVEIAESYAQGEATYEQLTAARQAANWDAAAQAGQSPDDGAWGYAFNAARDVAQDSAAQGALHTSAAVVEAAIFAAGYVENEQLTFKGLAFRQMERRLHCDLLRDVFGNPFRPLVLDPACRTPTVVSLARAAYDERQLPGGELDTQRLAVLADALEEAGVPDELAAHLRSPGPHVRGCFAVDLCLGLS